MEYIFYEKYVIAYNYPPGHGIGENCPAHINAQLRHRHIHIHVHQLGQGPYVGTAHDVPQLTDQRTLHIIQRRKVPFLLPQNGIYYGLGKGFTQHKQENPF